MVSGRSTQHGTVASRANGSKVDVDEGKVDGCVSGVDV